VRFGITRFVVEGNTVLPAGEIDALLAPYAGPAREFADVQRALEALQRAYAGRGFGMVRVVLPEQELDRGVVRLRVIEARIGRVTVEGNRFFDEANIRRSLPGLREGEAPNVARLSANLAQANENPAKKTTMRLKDGTRAGEVDARLIVADEKPWNLGLAVDNSGASSTGKTMVGVVYQNADLFGRDHVASVQYTTTAEEPQRVSVYGAGYHVPIYPLGDSADLYASYSDVDSGTVLAGIFDLQVSGRGTIFGARYNHAFPHLGRVDSTLTLGFEQKAYRNDVEFAGFQLGNDVTVRPMSLAYWGAAKGEASTTAFNMAAAHSFSQVAYSLARLGLAHSQALPGDWQLRAVVQGQYSRDALVPGEQFGAGGMNTVRGFDSREIAGDKGVAGSLEAYTPDLCGRTARFYCRVLAFGDAARVSRNGALPGEFAHQSIASAGVGLRAAIGRNVSAQVDIAHVIDAGPVSERGSSRVHFKLGLTY